MSLHDIESAFLHLKDKAEGDFHDLVLKLEAAYQHVQAAPLESIFKGAVSNELHMATIKLDNILNNLVLPVTQEVEEAAAVVEKVARKSTSRKPTTSE